MEKATECIRIDVAGTMFVWLSLNTDIINTAC